MAIKYFSNFKIKLDFFLDSPNRLLKIINFLSERFTIFIKFMAVDFWVNFIDFFHYRQNNIFRQ